MQFVEAGMPGNEEIFWQHSRCRGRSTHLDCTVCRQAQSQLQILSQQVRLCREVGISSPLHHECG